MAGFSSSTDSSSAQLLEGSETGRRFMLDYLHSKRSSRHKEEGGDGDTVGGGAVMTPAVLKAAALAHEGYETPALNDRLYLHYRGFRRLSRHLAAYSGLKALWLDSNGLATLSFEDSEEEEGRGGGGGGGGGVSGCEEGKGEDVGGVTTGKLAPSFPPSSASAAQEDATGLRALSQLRCLYLQNNLLARVGDGLRGLTALVTLDLSHNRLTRLDGLNHLPNLRFLNVARNYLHDDDDRQESGIAHLVACPALTNADLSHNELGSFERSVAGALARVPTLLSINVAGNPLVSTAQFRKRAIVAMPRLRYLDRPVFEQERLAAEAWATGGPEAEKAAREAYKHQEQEAHKASLRSYREWARRVRAERDGGVVGKCEGDGSDDGSDMDGKGGLVGGADGSEEEEEKEEEDGDGGGVVPPLVGPGDEKSVDGGEEGGIESNRVGSGLSPVMRSVDEEGSTAAAGKLLVDTGLGGMEELD